MSQQSRAGRRVRATSAIGKLVRKALTPAARRRGFAEANILDDWEAIVGAVLASRCQPIRLAFARGRSSGGVLHMRVGGGAAIEIMHITPQIIERVNDYYGFIAVREIKLLQAPLHYRRRKLKPKPPPPLSDADEAALNLDVSRVADDTLQQSLLRLGRSIKQRKAISRL